MAYGDNQLDGRPEGFEDGNEPLTFHYKQGSFRQYEHKSMSDLATGENQPARGLFKSLVSTKANRFIFLILIVCVGLVLVVSLLSGKPNENSAGGLYFELTPISYGEKVYSSLKMTVAGAGRLKNPNRDYSPRNIHAVFIYYDADGNELFREGEDGRYPEEEHLVALKEGDGSAPKPGFIRNSYNDYEVSQVECVVTVRPEDQDNVAVFDGESVSVKAKVTQQ